MDAFEPPTPETDEDLAFARPSPGGTGLLVGFAASVPLYASVCGCGPIGLVLGLVALGAVGLGCGLWLARRGVSFGPTFPAAAALGTAAWQVVPWVVLAPTGIVHIDVPGGMIGALVVAIGWGAVTGFGAGGGVAVGLLGGQPRRSG